jgi:xylan 1,4-beta-xylosidase
MKTNYLLSLILLVLFVIPASAQRKFNDESALRNRIIHLDYNKIKGAFSTMLKECVGAGCAKEGLREDWQQQLAYVTKECVFLEQS